MTQADYWNHNVHYQPVILNAVPDGCGAALEVGCGDGLLAGRLAERAAEVTAIDRDAEMIALARERVPGTRVRFVQADFLAYAVEAASYDFACANTVLHHIRGHGGPGAPVKDPEMTWAEVHATARDVLPGVRYRRHLLWRYSLRWRKPGG